MKQINFRTFIPVLALVVLGLGVTMFNARFLSMPNMQVIGKQVAILLVAAVGQTFVILTGGIDLSLLGIMSMSSLTLSMLVQNVKTPYDLGLLAIPIALAMGGAFGFVKRFPAYQDQDSLLHGHPGHGLRGIGLAVIIYKGRPIKILDQTVRGMALGKTMGIPNIILIALFILLLAIFISKYTRLGRYIYGMGGDEAKLKTVGISVEKYKIMMFTLAGIFFGAAGILFAARTGGGHGQDPPAIPVVCGGGRGDRRHRPDRRGGTDLADPGRGPDSDRPGQRPHSDAGQSLHPGRHHRCGHHRRRGPDPGSIQNRNYKMMVTALFDSIAARTAGCLRRDRTEKVRGDIRMNINRPGKTRSADGPVASCGPRRFGL